MLVENENYIKTFGEDEKIDLEEDDSNDDGDESEEEDEEEEEEDNNTEPELEQR